MKKITLILFLSLVTAVSCGTKFRNMQSFETVWQTVNAKHYDPTFGGVDWEAVHGRYKPGIAAAKDDAKFYELTNQMLFELNLSHLLVASRSDLKRYMPVLFAEGTIGIDIKWINGDAVISAVKPGTPADKAGLHPGYIIVGVDGKSIGQIVSNEKKYRTPPFNDRNCRNNLSNYILGHIYGSPDTTVKIAYRDESDNIQQRTIERESRGRAISLSPTMPPAFIEFESKRLANNIDYIRFNHFAEPVDTKFIAAIEAIGDSRGMVIDLRANPGGFFSVLDTMAEHLVFERVLLYQYKFRNRIVDKVIDPVAGPFKKPVVVLVDERSMSCSELFAGSMQAVKRAVIVGNRTPGYLLGANWIRLLNGGYFMHTILQPLPSNGAIIEDHGVMPDVEVSLDREALLEGRDTQLDAAIKYILENN
jgi:carboxyl-terminal processing protease